MKKYLKTSKLFLDGIGLNNLPAHAAASAFFMFLSLVPFVALITAILPYTGLSQEALIGFLSRYIPDALEELIVSLTDDIYFASGVVLPVTIVITIYLASRSFSALIRGIEVICGAKNFAPFLKRSLMACIYTIALIITMVLVLLMMVFGRQLMSLISEGVPIVSPVVAFLIKFRFLLVILVLSCVFVAIYCWVPGMKLGFGALIPGSVITASLWLLFTWLFSLFIRFGNGFSTYGNLAAIVICLMWMYWCMFIILLGAYLNVFLHAVRVDRQNGESFDS